MTSKIFFPQPVGAVSTPTTRPGPVEKPRGSFSQILNEKLIPGEIKFSNHAQQRLKSRSIQLSEGDMQKLKTAVDKARAKGARESLILFDRLALVVSVKNNTVITAVDGDSLRENVFTNIDSAVIV